VPVGRTSRRAPRATSAGLVSGFALLLLATSVALAVPAAAIDDPTRPDARVTHGPSCRPGGLVVEVTAGTVPYFVRLATTRAPAGEDEATLAPGTTVVLRSDDVDWGETIDGRIEYAARDDSGAIHVDELDTYSFTRPTQEDCEAVLAPQGPTVAPSPSATVVTPSATERPSASPVTTTGGQTSAPLVAGAESPAMTPPTAGSTTDPRQVTVGGSVTLFAAGFLPGERVTVLLHGTDTVLASATAGPDGSAVVEVRIPEGTAPGQIRVDMVGHSSESSTDVQLQVAALATAAPGDGPAELVPLVAAACVLVATVAGLVSVAGRQRVSARRLPLRSA
jgi:hypothetical protein